MSDLERSWKAQIETVRRELEAHVGRLVIVAGGSWDSAALQWSVDEAVRRIDALRANADLAQSLHTALSERDIARAERDEARAEVVSLAQELQQRSTAMVVDGPLEPVGPAVTDLLIQDGQPAPPESADRGRSCGQCSAPPWRPHSDDCPDLIEPPSPGPRVWKKGDPEPTARPLSELRDSGLLWLINRVVFHPRGFALAIHVAESGEFDGWELLGDGSEVWSFPPGDEAGPFKAASATLAGVIQDGSNPDGEAH